MRLFRMDCFFAEQGVGFGVRWRDKSALRSRILSLARECESIIFRKELEKGPGPGGPELFRCRGASGVQRVRDLMAGLIKSLTYPGWGSLGFLSGTIIERIERDGGGIDRSFLSVLSRPGCKPTVDSDGALSAWKKARKKAYGKWGKTVSMRNLEIEKGSRNP